MVTLEIRLPDSLHERLRLTAERQGISINNLVETAIAEKLSALETETLLLERTRKGSSVAFLSVLAKVPSDRRWTDLKRGVQCLRTAVN